MLSNRRLHSAKISDAINIEVRVSFYSNIPFIQNEPEAQQIGVIANTNLWSVVMLLYNPFRRIHIDHNISCERGALTRYLVSFSHKITKTQHAHWKLLSFCPLVTLHIIHQTMILWLGFSFLCFFFFFVFSDCFHQFKWLCIYLLFLCRQ